MLRASEWSYTGAHPQLAQDGQGSPTSYTPLSIRHYCGTALPGARDPRLLGMEAHRFLEGIADNRTHRKEHADVGVWLHPVPAGRSGCYGRAAHLKLLPCQQGLKSACRDVDPLTVTCDIRIDSNVGLPQVRIT